jgi:hypothetical protein
VPRPRQTSIPHLSPAQAQYVLERLLGDRRVSRGEIAGYVSDLHREITELEARLASLRAASGAAPAARALAPAAAAPVRRRRGRRPGRPGRPGRPPGRPRTRSAITAEQLASRQLQGRYLALIRQIPATRRGQYTKIAKEKGRQAAIDVMRDVLKK